MTPRLPLDQLARGASFDVPLYAVPTELPDQANDDLLVADAIRYTGLSPAELTTAVMVGCRAGNLITALRRALPNLRQLLVLEPDLRSFMTLRERASEISVALDGVRCMVAPLPTVGANYAHDAHIEVLGYLMGVGANPSKVVSVMDPWADRGAEGRYAPTATAVHDLLWGASANFVELFDRAGQMDALLKSPLGRNLHGWADFLFEQQELFTALRWYTIIYRSSPNPVLATRIAIAWGQIGCPTQALTWLEKSSVPDDVRQATAADIGEVATLQRQQAQAQWAANLAFFRRSWPAVAEVLEHATRLDAEVVWLADLPWCLRIGTESFTVTREHYPLLVTQAEGRLRVVNPPDHPAALRHQLEGTQAMTKRHVCIGAVRQYASLMNALRNRIVSTVPNWRQSVVVAESNPAALRLLCEAVDLSTVLQPNNVETIWVDDDAEQQLLDFFANAPRRTIPRIRAACSRTLIDGFAAIESARSNTYEQARQELQGYYDADFAKTVAAKLERGEPLRVWGWTSIHTTVLQHVARGLIDGFRALGHKIELLVEDDPREQIEAFSIASSLAAFKPDLVLLIDHTRPEYGPLFPAQVPVVAWILDELPALTDPRVLARLGPLDFAFAWSAPLTDLYLRAGYPHCEQLVFAVDTQAYHRGDVPAKDVVAFATHLALPYEPLYAPGLYREIEAKMARMPTIPAGRNEIAPLLDETLAEHGWHVPDDQRTDVAYQCLMVARHADRVRVADQIIAAGLPLALYGRGWDEVERFKPYARGLLAPGAPLCNMYRTHKVVLHINTRCNLHPRVLEAAASGSFVLARSDGYLDFLPGWVNDHLEVDRELCLFTDEADMIAKIRRALSDEPWRQSFVQAAHDRVHRDHTYRARASEILAALRRRGFAGASQAPSAA